MLSRAIFTASRRHAGAAARSLRPLTTSAAANQVAQPPPKRRLDADLLYAVTPRNQRLMSEEARQLYEA
jgi:hypothetical protein